MLYLELYNTLKQKTNYIEDCIRLSPGLCLRNFDFDSRIRFKLPEDENAENHAIPTAVTSNRDAHGIHTLINKRDGEIDENLRFRYHILIPVGTAKASEIVILFHG